MPAGSFKDVLLVETEYWDPSIDEDAPLLAYQDYYARGVGLLRSVTKNVRDGGHKWPSSSARLRFSAAEATGR